MLKWYYYFLIAILLINGLALTFLTLLGRKLQLCVFPLLVLSISEASHARDSQHSIRCKHSCVPMCYRVLQPVCALCAAQGQGSGKWMLYRRAQAEEAVRPKAVKAARRSRNGAGDCSHKDNDGESCSLPIWWIDEL